MCWENVAAAGVFDSDRAKDVAERLLAELVAACEPNPFVDAEQGIVLCKYDPDELHQVQLDNDGWTILHPLRERLDGSLFDCEFNWSSGDIGYRGRYWLDDNGQLGELVNGGEG